MTQPTPHTRRIRLVPPPAYAPGRCAPSECQSANCGYPGRGVARRLTAIVFILGTLGSALAPNATVTVGARIILGPAVGCVSPTVPLYIGEIPPADRRGRLVNQNQFMIVTGQQLACISALKGRYHAADPPARRTTAGHTGYASDIEEREERPAVQLGLSWTQAAAVVVSTIGVYVGFLVLIKVFGQRALASMSSFDFAAAAAASTVPSATFPCSSWSTAPSCTTTCAKPRSSRTSCGRSCGWPPSTATTTSPR